jgi:hypothetical protein
MTSVAGDFSATAFCRDLMYDSTSFFSMVTMILRVSPLMEEAQELLKIRRGLFKDGVRLRKWVGED